MGSSTHQLVRIVLVAVLATVGVSPVAGQFGGLKKKLKTAAGAPQAKEEPAPPGQPGGGDGGGTIVLDDDVLDRYLVYFKTVQAEREAAKKEDTPYGRYLKADAAAQAAAAKCKAAQNAWPQRLTQDQKLMERANAISEKMAAAMEKGDTKLYQTHARSLTELMDPSCLVEPPTRPGDWSEMQRQVDERAEKKGAEASGFEGRDLGLIGERATAILKDAPGPDISQSEISAVKKREGELKRAMGLEEVPAARASNAAPGAAGTAAPAPTAPQPSAEQRAMGECANANAEKHNEEVKRLGELAAAASEAGNTAAAITYSDSIRQLMQQGCPGN
jgi:hypothetical protein